MTSHGIAEYYLMEVVLKYDGDNCLPWLFGTNQGYGVYTDQSGKTHVVSNFVCNHVYGPRPSKKHQAAHSCGNGMRGCVTKNHIRWRTAQENIVEKYKHQRLKDSLKG